MVFWIAEKKNYEYVFMGKRRRTKRHALEQFGYSFYINSSNSSAFALYQIFLRSIHGIVCCLLVWIP